MHNQKGTTTSATNKVYVHFYSDMSYAGRGFVARYKSIAASKSFYACVFEIKMTFTQISPSHPLISNFLLQNVAERSV